MKKQRQCRGNVIQANLNDDVMMSNQGKAAVKVKESVKKDSCIGGSETPINQNKVKNKVKNSERIPEIKTLEKKVLESIFGQDDQVRKIITAIYRAKFFESIKTNMLVIGNSGTGKTETIKQIASNLNVPCTIEDATKYTKEGYYGSDVSEMIYNLLDNAGNNFKRAKSGIIVVDEIDKKVSGFGGDVSGSDVLKSMLKIIEGTIIKIPPGFEVDEEGLSDEELEMFYEAEESYNAIDFDTKDIIIIFSGAFVGLDKVREKRLNTNTLGFQKCAENNQNQSQNFTKEDLVNYGMPEEFVGRIDTIVEMKALTKEDMVEILKFSKLSIFKKYKEELEKLGVLLYHNDELFERIAEKSLSVNTGARELSLIVNQMFENILYDVLSNRKMYEKCILSDDIVRDNKKYELS